MSRYLDWKYITIHSIAALFVGWMIYNWVSEWWKGRK